LPAPLGPMTAWVSPAAISRWMSRDTTRPPNRLVRPTTLSIASAMAGSPACPCEYRRAGADKAFLQENADQDHEDSKRQLQWMLHEDKSHSARKKAMAPMTGPQTSEIPPSTTMMTRSADLIQERSAGLTNFWLVASNAPAMLVTAPEMAN